MKKSDEQLIEQCIKAEELTAEEYRTIIESKNVLVAVRFMLDDQVKEIQKNIKGLKKLRGPKPALMALA